ncbi:hypothetical protein OG271_03890 [Micromonospora rifamycinica]|uniref:hypothetical protein n=1 Tax=Micromonospora rifamycinica TaxID=291594 RepID=UPI002E2E02DB|nr:hypothetical protein [Micromonospora rifamycinica]
MNPHNFHARAAGLAVREARTRLAELAAAAARVGVDHRLQAAAVLRSPSYGTRHAIGGHGDPVGGLIDGVSAFTQDTTWVDLYRRSTSRLDWLARMIRADQGSAVGRILTAIPGLLPGTAAIVAQHLADEDAWVRAAVGLGPACSPLPGVPCPHCGERQLQVLTAGPVDAWTVICATGRLCTGTGCPCGMPGAVEGVAHIWPRAAVLGAVAGVTR